MVAINNVKRMKRCAQLLICFTLINFCLLYSSELKFESIALKIEINYRCLRIYLEGVQQIIAHVNDSAKLILCYNTMPATTRFYTCSKCRFCSCNTNLNLPKFISYITFQIFKLIPNNNSII